MQRIGGGEGKKNRLKNMTYRQFTEEEILMSNEHFK